MDAFDLEVAVVFLAAQAMLAIETSAKQAIKFGRHFLII
jgi:hypothetical protein